MSFSVEGRKAIVTGAANGIGLAIARHLLDQGAHVMLADIDEERLAHELGDESRRNERVRCFGGDLRQKLTIANLLSATIDAFDRIDILVNASRQCVQGDPTSVDCDSVAEMLDQNLMTSLRLSQTVARRMIAQAEDQGDGPRSAGSIVNLSSIAARRTHPSLMAYSISAAAVDQMTRALAVVLAPQRIRVNAVAFGSVMSASLQTRLRDDAGLRSQIRASTPLGRIAAADEVAEAVQFLASDAADFVTGQILTVDGGRTLIDPANASSH